MVAGVVLVQFPDLSLPAVCGIGSMLGIAGYQVIEIAIQRRFKGRGETVMPVINTHQNIAAFLDMLAVSEGTANHPLTKNRGYDVIVTGLDGSRKFSPTTVTTRSHMADRRRCLTVAVKIHGLRSLSAALPVLAALPQTACPAGFQSVVTGQTRHSVDPRTRCWMTSGGTH